ncbi:chloride channel protein [Nocardioides sp. NPDC059952]|uniref:chloride channel protein n=1 Tax=Nocardioides sp. NPDC059952 TaxID=3347014 RepID=UPI003658DB0D
MSTPTPIVRGYLGLVALGMAIGIPAALAAALFLAVVHWAEDWLWHDLPADLGYDSAPWFLVIGLPITGALIVWLARRFLPGDGGHSPVDGLSMAPTPVRYAPSIVLAALGSLPFGVILGPEAPVIAIGSAVGMVFAGRRTMSPETQGVLASAGSFSAVSALFGGPLVGGLLLLEAGLATGAQLVPVLVPGLVAAATGYLLFVGLGDWGGISSAGLQVPDLPAYDGTRLVDVALAIVVGIVAAILMGVAHRGAERVHTVVTNSRRLLVPLVLGGLAIGLLTLLTEALGGELDDVLFSGQSAIGEVVNQSAGVIVVVLLAKALGFAVCMGVGFRGGAVFPAVFLGVGVASLCVAMFDCSPTWAVAVGAAAGMTAGTGLLFCGMLFAMLLVGKEGADALPAAVFASVAAWLVRSSIAARLGARE